MRKTLALFALAMSLLVTAVIVVLSSGPETPPPPKTVKPRPTRIAASPVASATWGSVVEVRGQLSNGYFAASHPQELSMVFELEADKRASGPHPDTAVALVIDRSGSMADEKIRQARRAAKMLVSRLGDRDQIAIVTYSSDYAVDLPLTRLEGRRNHINRVIDEILDGGGTNLSGGLQAGLKALRPSQPDVARRLILLSDGNANQGITDPTAIGDIAARARRSGVTITTLGVGVDFNEDLMTLVAQSGGGGYYYARSGAAIADAFEKELDGLKALTARQVELSIELPPGVRISEVFGYRTEVSGGRIIVPVGDMASGEKRRVILTLAVESMAANTQTPFSVIVRHRSPSGFQPHEASAQLVAISTKDAAKVVLGASRDVEEVLANARAARARQEAATSFSRGQRERAVRALKDTIAHARKVNADLRSPKLRGQVVEMQKTLNDLTSFGYDSDDGKDLIKREKLQAHQVFTY